MQLFFRFLMTIALAIALAQPGRAGGWALDHYEVVTNSPGETHTDKLTYVTLYSGPTRGYYVPEEVLSAEAGSYGTVKYPRYSVQEGRYPTTTASALTYRGSDQRDHTAPSNQLSPGGAQAVMTVTPVFKWISSNSSEPPSEEFWIWEKSDVKLSYSHGRYPEPYTAEHPYNGQNFAVGGINLGLGGNAPGLSRSYPLSSNGTVHYGYVEDSATQTRPKLMKSKGQREVYGATRTLWASVKSPGWDAADLGVASYGSGPSAASYVSVSYQADVTDFTLGVSTNEFSRLVDQPRRKDINAYASQSETGEMVLGKPVYSWSGSANYSAQLSSSMLNSISKPGSQNPVLYHWNTSGSWADGAQSTNQNSISSIYNFGTGPTLTYAPKITNAQVIVEGDNVESGLLTANAKINWYSEPSTRYRIEFETVGIDLESGEEVNLADASDGLDESYFSTENEYRAAVAEWNAEVKEKAEITKEGLEFVVDVVKPDVVDLIPVAGKAGKFLYKSIKASGRFASLTAKVTTRLASKSDKLKALARLKLNRGPNHPFIIRNRIRSITGGRLGKLKPNAARQATPNTERVSKVTSFFGRFCFVPGTLVHTEHGLRVIESLKAGDLVWAKDEASGGIALKRIAQTFERVAPSTLALTFSNGETIETTEEHPFYVQDRGFTPAGLVAIGNSIVTRAGPSLQVTRIEERNSAQKVYNFEVEDYHTYFVENDSTNIGLIVRGDNAETGVLTAKINWYEMPYTTYRAEVVTEIIDYNTGQALDLDAVMSGGNPLETEEERALDEFTADYTAMKTEFVQTGAQLVCSALEAEMMVGSWFVPDECARVEPRFLYHNKSGRLGATMKFRAGIDGGGTSTTRAVVIDRKDRVVGRGQGDSSNLYNLGIEAALSSIEVAVAGALSAAQLSRDAVSSWGFGLAGISGAPEKARWRAALAPLYRGDLAVDEDVAAAWAGALGPENLGAGGAVLIAGTGANCFGRNARGQRARVDGWGPLLGDRGSGYWLGESGIRAAIAAFDGAAPPTQLQAALLSHFAVETIESLVGVVYAADFRRDRVAAFVPHIIESARAGDAVAADLLRQSGRQLSQTARAVLQPLDLKKLALTGGLLQNSPEIRAALQRNLGETIELCQPRFEAVVGAAFLPALEVRD